MPAAPICLATYNIHRCVGRDGRQQPGQVAAVINEMKPDLIGLQEVEWHVGADAERDQLSTLARLTGLTSVAGPTIVRSDCHYGNALLTRLPVLRQQIHDLSFTKREPRGALDVLLQAEGGVLRVVVTHLGLKAAERRWQIRRLLCRIAHPLAQPTVLLGDINEWTIWGRPIRWLSHHFGHAPRLATFPARFPVLSLDRIWVHDAELVDVSAHRSELARRASDHLPLKAMVRPLFKPAARPEPGVRSTNPGVLAPAPQD